MFLGGLVNVGEAVLAEAEGEGCVGTALSIEEAVELGAPELVLTPKFVVATAGAVLTCR